MWTDETHELNHLPVAVFISEVLFSPASPEFDTLQCDMQTQSSLYTHTHTRVCVFMQIYKINVEF